MKCPKCKKQLRKGAKFCPACGARIEKKRGIRFTSILLVIVLLLSIVAIGWSGGILFAKHFGGKLRNLFSGKENVEIHNVEEAIAHARDLGEVYGYENALSELTEKVTTTIDGDNYYRLQQNYQGIPVYGRTVVYTTDEEGGVLSLSGNASDVVINDSLTPTVSESQCFKVVESHYFSMLGKENAEETDFSSYGEAELCIYSLDEKNCCLAYRIKINGYEYLVDAHSAKILLVNSIIQSAMVSGELRGQRKTYESVSYTVENQMYSLEDSTRGITACIADNDFQWWKFWSPEWVYKKADVVSWTNGDNPDPAAVDAYSSVQSVYNYFDIVLKNKSVDGSGRAKISVVTNFIDLKDNAQCYITDNEHIELRFGKTSADKPILSAYIDVVAHEYMHGVEQFHSGMIYSGESGAIMEGLSDIFGELVEAWDKVQSKDEEGRPDTGSYPNWVISDFGRNMVEPNSNEFPEIFNGMYWANTDNPTEDNDWGGVHKNSTVISHAAYLMWNGGTLGDSTKKISETKLAELWYRAMLLMPSDCNFVECRTLVELAASNMHLENAQKQCVCEAFDAVGIPRASEEEYSQLVHLVANGETSIKGTVYEIKTENGIETVVPIPKATMTVYSGNSTKAHKKLNMKDENGFFAIELPAGTYSVAITADGYIGQTISFELADNEVRYFSVELTPSDNKTGNNTDAYSAYLNATQKTMASGSWSEHLVMTANMSITDGNAKTKTKVTLTSDADVSNYSENDPSQIRMSGSAEMTVMGQTYAWDMEYENGTAHYRYTKPNQTSADMKIDPSFFNFGTITSDMMTNAKMSGNKITFTVPGEKIAEVGIAAVNQMSGVDDLEYGDVDVTVIISADGKIDTITMVFHASLEYQGYDADVDYNIDYRFSDSPNSSSQPVSSGVPIVPGIYAQDGSDYNTLTVHETDGQTLEFTAFWYRIADIYHAIAEVNGNAAAFEYIGPDVNWQAAGTLQSPSENTIVLTISDSTHEYINTGEYRYSLIGKIFSDAELKAISAALNVPADLDAEITQGEPGYWEGGGIYRTPIDIYYNGELIAGASVNSLTGEIAGNIYVYSAPDASRNSVNLASTFGFSKAWDIHDRSGTEHFVTSLAFSDDGTFCCAVGWYLSEWYAAFTGTYQVNGNEIILNYTLDGDTKMSSYQVKWEDQILRQTSEENLVIAHQIGSEYSFEENPWYTAEQLKDQVSTFMRYNG